MFGIRFKWREQTRKMVQDATLHPSVKQRFEERQVLIYDAERPYRPDLLATHMAFKEVYLKEAQARESQDITVATAEAPEKHTC
jgi:hypothetical protein